MLTVLVHKCADTSSTADAVPLPLEGKAKAKGGQTLVKRWDAGFEAAARNKGKGNKKSPAKGEGVSYSIRNTKTVQYKKQVHSFYSTTGYQPGRSDDLFVHGEMDTNPKFELAKKPFFMLKKNVKKVIRTGGKNENYSAHDIQEETMLRIPNHIESPALVVVGDGRVSIIASETVKTPNTEKAPLLIGIDPNSSVDNNPANEIKSIYGVDKFESWIKLRAEDSRIYAGDKRKAAALLRDVGLQLPEPVAYAADPTPLVKSHQFADVKRSARKDGTKSSLRDSGEGLTAEEAGEHSSPLR